MFKILSVIGARPQFIKAASLSRELESRKGLHETIVHTGQHYDSQMSDVFFRQLGIGDAAYNLGVGSGTHAFQTAEMIKGIEKILLDEDFDLLLVYGDTNSTLAGALAASKLNIPIAHVEAGLRSFNNSMPEEINRIVTDRIASLHFCPSITAINNLENEGVNGKYVIETGDIMLETLQYCRDKLLPAFTPENALLSDAKSYALVTIHRADNTDTPEKLETICRHLIKIAEKINVIFPVHPRTRVALERNAHYEKLASRVSLVEPVGFIEMVQLLEGCQLVITDSGGLQKEAYFMNKKSVIVRGETEWVELVEAGAAKLCRLDHDGDLSSLVLSTLEDEVNLPQGIYGNGRSSAIICDAILSYADEN